MDHYGKKGMIIFYLNKNFNPAMQDGLFKIVAIKKLVVETSTRYVKALPTLGQPNSTSVNACGIMLILAVPQWAHSKQ
jgi:hypothetical protein